MRQLHRQGWQWPVRQVGIDKAFDAGITLQNKLIRPLMYAPHCAEILGAGSLLHLIRRTKNQWKKISYCALRSWRLRSRRRPTTTSSVPPGAPASWTPAWRRWTSLARRRCSKRRARTLYSRRLTKHSANCRLECCRTIWNLRTKKSLANSSPITSLTVPSLLNSWRRRKCRRLMAPLSTLRSLIKK